MRPVGLIGVSLVGLIAVAIASKARAATTSGTASKPEPPPKPKPKAKPLLDNAPVTGLPPEIADLLEAANSSNDPAFIRDVAYQLSEHYSLQAAHLLNLAAILEGEYEAAPPEP